MNEPAFPVPYVISEILKEHGVTIKYETGMTLRDYFAGQCELQLMEDRTNGPLAIQWTQTEIEEYYASVAKRAYMMADAMLKQREVKTKEN